MPNPTKLLIDGHSLQLSDVGSVTNSLVEVELSSKAKTQLNASRQVVERSLASGEIVYGVTTGFGKFKDVLIKEEDTQRLQRNLLLSHAAGVGPAFDTQTVRAIMLIRANSLAKGFSGIRQDVVQLLLNCLNNNIHPIVPQQGSLGASGDLAPLAHLALVLIGEGQAEYKDKFLSGADALKMAKLSACTLEAKEGLALLNGTQVMSALGCLLVLEAERLCKIADLISAMTLEALLGSVKSFAQEIQKVRPHPGQIASAQNMRLLLKNSRLMESHADCGMVQDAYSLRCIPQVHGASRQAFQHLREILEIEINSATDNPLVFADSIISGGNFHGQPLALALDYVATALSELGNISERRTERLVNPALSNGLPAFLTSQGGLNSGLMIAHYTAAALVSENKSLSYPASVDSIPTSANQEDHVSMGTIAARKAKMILENLRKILAIELLCASQALDFRTLSLEYHPYTKHKDIKQLAPAPGIKAAWQLVREHIPYLNEDRELHIDINKAEELIQSGQLLAIVESAIGALV